MSETHIKTLWELIAGDDVQVPRQPRRIIIPRIQRDYAHGRGDKAAVEIRDTLLGELIASLNEGASPADLGLIFGAKNDESVTLYDGQQRFTTLFLFHWYLAWISRDLQAGETLQRFSYDSRLHSRDFCRVLAGSGLLLEPNGAYPSERFKDAAWFCPAWRTDPTVDGMLVVLDSMHRMLPNQQDAAVLWQRLTSNRAPQFTWLVLPDGSANEDLYVKLNGRGRNLTDFEKLKAWLEEQVDSWSGVALPEDWKLKLDNQWLDLFWKESGSNPDTMDRTMIAFFLGNALNLAITGNDGFDAMLIQTVHDKGILTKEEWGSIFTVQSLPKLFQALVHLTKPEFRDQIDQWASNGNLLCFSETSEKRLAPLSKTWIAGWTAATYTDRLLFFGLLRFLIENPPGTSGWSESTFLRWMRFLRNLACNSQIGWNSLANAIKSIQSIAPNSLEALDQWVSEQPNESKLTGLDKDQWQDEIEKATLRFGQTGEETAAVLDAAEDQPFLRGQIGFMIALATAPEGFNLGRFRSYAAVMARLFPTGNGPDPENRVLLQQALLSCGDYTIELSPDKWGMGANRNEWRTIFNIQRDTHLKNSGNSSVLKTLLDHGPEVSLENFRDNHEARLDWANWRKWMVASKAPLEFCQYSTIGWIDAGDTAILVSKSTYGSKTAELRTYFLYWEKLNSAGWEYASGLQQNSYVFRANERFRLEIRHAGHLEVDPAVPKHLFALRVLCKDKDLPPGFNTPPNTFPLQLRDDELANKWQNCGLLYLEFNPCNPCYPEEIAMLAQEKWESLIRC